MDVSSERQRTDERVRAGAVAALAGLAVLCLTSGEPAWWWLLVLVGASATTVATGVALERWLPDGTDELEVMPPESAAGADQFMERGPV